MKTETTLCDLCKEKVAKFKCEICEKDCCKNHIQTFFLRSNGVYGKSTPSIYLCKNCWKKSINLTIPKETVTDWIRNSITVSELKEKTK